MLLEQSDVEREQPETDSPVNENDQAEEPTEEEEETEQPETDSEESASESETVTIDGKEYTLDEIKSGMMMQGDYTKSKQELAEKERELSRLIDSMKSKPEKEDEVPPEVKQALDILKKHGVATHEDVEKKFQILSAKQEDERQFIDMLTQNPELKKHAEFIKAYGYQHAGVSWSDIASKFRKSLGIENQKKLKKAKDAVEPKGVKGEKRTKDGELTETERKFMNNLPRGFQIKS